MKRLNSAWHGLGQKIVNVLKGPSQPLRREEGASLVEYALLIALIALLSIAAVATIGGYVSNVYNNTKNALDANGVK